MPPTDQTPTEPSGADVDDVPSDLPDDVPEDLPEDIDEADVVADVEDAVQSHPIVQLFGDHAKTRFLAVLIRADGTPLTVSDLCDKANVDRSTWYEHKDDLMETGVVENISEKSYQQLRLVPREQDARSYWLDLLNSWTGAFLREGRRPELEG